MTNLKTNPGLIRIHNNHVFTDTLAIAEGVELEHASVIKLVRKFKIDFEEFGLVRFEIAPRLKGRHGGGDIEFAELNEDQATYLITLFKNTEIVRAFKIKLVKAFRKAINEIDRLKRQQSEPAWMFVRDETKIGFKWMNKALQETRESKGKKTKPFHYANEARMVNAVLSGCFTKLNRDSLSSSDLQLIGELQRINALLIAQDIPYSKRKEILTDRTARLDYQAHEKIAYFPIFD